tara:strand:+ start:2178 stop:2408 length:231 start_codon:yes stop_codon:yes gene_type:complete
MDSQIVVLIYLICFVSLAGATFAFMYTVMMSTLRDFDKPRVRKKTVIPAPHPEMQGVKYGEELLVFRREDNDSGDE